MEDLLNRDSISIELGVPSTSSEAYQNLQWIRKITINDHEITDAVAFGSFVESSGKKKMFLYYQVISGSTLPILGTSETTHTSFLQR